VNRKVIGISIPHENTLEYANQQGEHNDLLNVQSRSEKNVLNLRPRKVGEANHNEYVNSHGQSNNDRQNKSVSIKRGTKYSHNQGPKINKEFQEKIDRMQNREIFEDDTKNSDTKVCQTRLYRDYLIAQIKERKQRKYNSKISAYQEEKQILEESFKYNYYGRGGGGAPRRDKQGRVITNRSYATELAVSSEDSNRQNVVNYIKNETEKRNNLKKELQVELEFQMKENKSNCDLATIKLERKEAAKQKLMKEILREERKLERGRSNISQSEKKECEQSPKSDEGPKEEPSIILKLGKDLSGIEEKIMKNNRELSRRMAEMQVKFFQSYTNK
jgi:hypothetical protein